MDLRSVPTKTPRGREELRTRAHKLSVLARRLLIVSDGRHTVEELALGLGLSERDPEVQITVRDLIEGQYLWITDADPALGPGRRASRSSRQPVVIRA